jgi:hypothetical protein
MKNFLPVRCIDLILPGARLRTQSCWTFVVATRTLKPVRRSSSGSIRGVAATALPTRNPTITNAPIASSHFAR